jgi:hypothetical protein
MRSKRKLVYSDFLFAKPSPINGAARFFDFGAAFDTYNVSASEDEADARALHSDWAMVGEDIESATGQFDEETVPNREAV